MKIENTKVLMIIAFQNFRDEEFVIPYTELQKHKAQVTICSTQKGEAQGMFGHKVKVDLSTQEVKSEDYQVLIYVGGKGTQSVRSDSHALRIISESLHDDKKIISAICWAPTILAKAGALKNKKASVWLGEDSEYQMTTDKVLEHYGSKFIKENVVVDGKTITANGAPAALDFAKAIIKKIEEL